MELPLRWTFFLKVGMYTRVVVAFALMLSPAMAFGKGVIEGEDFRQAWLRIWLGKHSADADLKQGLLGTD